jgi:hypothetical protein
VVLHVFAIFSTHCWYEKDKLKEWEKWEGVEKGVKYGGVVCVWWPMVEWVLMGLYVGAVQEGEVSSSFYRDSSVQ